MKTAISIQSDMMEEADVEPGQMGLSRSRLIALALKEFLHHRREKALLVQLNRASMARAAAPGNVTLRSGDANLPQESVVNVSQNVTVDKAELTEPEGKLSIATLTEIRNGLPLLFG